MTNQVITAFQIAMKAHEGQTDKAGMPYILHPLTVAVSQETEEAFVAALLHDVGEDSDCTGADLRRVGIAEPVIEALKLLTHDKDGGRIRGKLRSAGASDEIIQCLMPILREEDAEYMTYVAEIKSNPIARAVKLADLRHNADLTRLSEVSLKDIERAEKYNCAAELLTVADKEEVNPFRARYGMNAMEFAWHLVRLPKERVLALIDIAERLTPKAEAGLRSIVEAVIYDDVVRDTLKNQAKNDKKDDE